MGWDGKLNIIVPFEKYLVCKWLLNCVHQCTLTKCVHCKMPILVHLILPVKITVVHFDKNLADMAS